MVWDLNPRPVYPGLKSQNTSVITERPNAPVAVIPKVVTKRQLLVQAGDPIQTKN